MFNFKKTDDKDSEETEELIEQNEMQFEENEDYQPEKPVMSMKKEAQIDDEEETEKTEEQVEEKGEYQLKKPLMVNGSEITKIPYDFGGVTAKDIMNVSRALKAKGVVVMMAQFDDENLLNLFAKAVSKCDSSIILNDLMRLSARDTFKITAMVRSFFYKADAEDTQQQR